MTRPLQSFTSIRAKLGAAIIAAVVVTIVLLYVVLAIMLPGKASAAAAWHSTGAFLRDAWWLLLLAGGLSGASALLLVRVLARGMTKPLRDMARATQQMSRGDYSQRVHTDSRDEVGRLAEAFNHMAADLEGLERLRRDLLANVSHELKTPIAAIRAHLENLLEGVEQPDRETLQVMLTQSERLSALVDQVLDLSRLDSGAAAMTFEPVALASVAGQVAAEVAIARRDRSVAVRNLIDPGLPAAQADRARVHQVLFNLLDNAVRLTPAGGEVSLIADRESKHVKVMVEDRGPGIARENIPLVFERFYRADASRSRSDGGAGLGLAIARSIVEAHGGRIGAEPRSGGGMRFWFTLPAAGPEAETPALAHAMQRNEEEM
ncbi:MAG TPA: ATP-binding protein [Actinomycetota bacterium]|nr:ATP-binding protein [Actinomycetota bacterium]